MERANKPKGKGFFGRNQRTPKKTCQKLPYSTDHSFDSFLPNTWPISPLGFSQTVYKPHSYNTSNHFQYFLTFSFFTLHTVISLFSCSTLQLRYSNCEPFRLCLLELNWIEGEIHFYSIWLCTKLSFCLVSIWNCFLLKYRILSCSHGFNQSVCTEMLFYVVLLSSVLMCTF